MPGCSPGEPGWALQPAPHVPVAVQGALSLCPSKKIPSLMPKEPTREARLWVAHIAVRAPRGSPRSGCRVKPKLLGPHTVSLSSLASLSSLSCHSLPALPCVGPATPGLAVRPARNARLPFLSLRGLPKMPSVPGSLPWYRLPPGPLGSSLCLGHCSCLPLRLDHFPGLTWKWT